MLVRGAVIMARAVYRGYPANGTVRRSARVTRLHVIRENAPSGLFQTWCGQGAGRHKNSDPIIIDPLPLRTPEGLSWCPACVGWLAARYGLLADIAESLAAYDPELYDDPEPRWARRRSARLAEGSS